MSDIQFSLPFDDADATKKVNERSTFEARWNTLVRDELPRLAAPNNWPISLDHCFMRVCLDSVFDKPWHLAIKRPAIRHLTDAQLLAAIAIAEGIAANPQTLSGLNTRSVMLRKLARTNKVTA